MNKQVKYIGIDLGGSKLRVADVDMQGNAGKERQSTVDNSISKAKLTEMIIRNVEAVVQKIHEEKHEVGGIGFGSPGPLDYRRGIIETPPNLPNIRNLPVVKILSESFPDYPAFLVHDADAALIGEMWLGEAVGFKNVAMVTFGTGIGFSVMDNGRLIRGNGRASETGHTDVNHGENWQVLCSCGRSNHWEPLINTDGLARIYCKVFNIELKGLSSKERYNVSVQMRKGISKNSPDSFEWQKVIEQYSRYVVLGLRNIMCNFDPECIVLGGGIMSGNEMLFNAVKKEWDDYVFRNYDNNGDNMARMAVGMELRLAKLPNAGVVGAAKYAMNMVDREKGRYAAEQGIVT